MESFPSYRALFLFPFLLHLVLLGCHLSAGAEDHPVYAIHKSKLILFPQLGYLFKDNLASIILLLSLSF